MASAGLTRLEAVNRILAACKLPRATALDTGTTSKIADAERYLDFDDTKIQANDGEGWHCNREYDVELPIPDRKIVASGGAGTFTYGEYFTQSSSSAVGKFLYEEGGSIYFKYVAGTFVDTAQTLTGVSSGATRSSTTEHAYPFAKVAASGGAGTYTAGETVTESTSAATGTFIYEAGGFVYLTPVTGTLVGGGKTLTGASSGATRTDTTVEQLTSGKIGLGTDMLAVDDWTLPYIDPTVRGAFLFDRAADDGGSYYFSQTIQVTLVRKITFVDLPETLKEFIVAESRMKFHADKMGGLEQDKLLRDERDMAKMNAMKADAKHSGASILRTPTARAIMGHRASTGWTRRI